MNNKQKGFTLAEMIISVAILSVVSIYILQMFIATKNLSIKSYEIDNSLRISKNIIELISNKEQISPNSKNEYIRAMKKQQDGTYLLNLDKDFVVAGENSLYSFSMNIEEKDGLRYIDIKCVRTQAYMLKKQDEPIEISKISTVKKIN